MIKLVVAYGPPEDPAAFGEYCASTHVPLVQKFQTFAGLRQARSSEHPMGRLRRTACLSSPSSLGRRLWCQLPSRSSWL
jgi:uncharacterized protein (TIGR02118 family)